LQSETAAFENFGYFCGRKEQSGSRQGQVFGILLGGSTALLEGSIPRPWSEDFAEAGAAFQNAESVAAAWRNRICIKKCDRRTFARRAALSA